MRLLLCTNLIYKTFNSSKDVGPQKFLRYATCILPVESASKSAFEFGLITHIQ